MKQNITEDVASSEKSARNYAGIFQDWEIAIAKKLVHEFKSNYPLFKGDDFEDLLQECLLHWYFNREEFDSEKKTCSKTYMVSVLKNKFYDLLDQRKAQKRIVSYFSTSLDSMENFDKDFNHSIPEFKETKLLNYTCDPTPGIELKIEIQSLLRELTPRQRDICLLITRHGLNMTEVSEHLKIPRGTLYDELKKIRIHLLEKGMDYSKK